MNIIEARQLCYDNGIYQLRRGESLHDAIDFLDGKLPERKGIKTKYDSGESMDRNAIVAESYRETFAKQTQKPASQENAKMFDVREDNSKPGKEWNCGSCDRPLRVDAEIDNTCIVTCEDAKCIDFAILQNCM